MKRDADQQPLTAGAACSSANPFSTRQTCPGALPFLFRSGEDAETLIDRLRLGGWWGEIVGPHGAGKSALLAALIPAIERAGRHPLLFELHDGQRRLPFDPERKVGDCPNFPLSENGTVPFGPSTLLVIDGYEQLSRWSRFRVKRLCRRRGLGLLITAHDSVGLPELYRTAADAELFQRIVVRLLAGEKCPWDVSELAARLKWHGGNLREALFELYDLYEQRPAAGNVRKNGHFERSEES
jgi:hypothetical protein